MTTISVHHNGTGFDVDTPSFGYWFKAGVALTLGAALTLVVLIPFYMVFQMAVSATLLRAMLR